MKKIINPWLDLFDEGYHCFGCSPRNPRGLKMEFYEDGEDIVSFWTPDDDYQGWLKTLHGGIHATLLDEVAGWVISRKIQAAGMTTQLNVKYRHPIPTGDDVKLEIRAHIKEQKRNFVIIYASIQCDGKVCSDAEITYYCFPKDRSAEEFYFKGCKIEGEE